MHYYSTQILPQSQLTLVPRNRSEETLSHTHPLPVYFSKKAGEKQGFVKFTIHLVYLKLKPYLQFWLMALVMLKSEYRGVIFGVVFCIRLLMFEGVETRLEIKQSFGFRNSLLYK
jgi:hypothetical protein